MRILSHVVDYNVKDSLLPRPLFLYIGWLRNKPERNLL
jgi:hypothetical protein